MKEKNPMFATPSLNLNTFIHAKTTIVSEYCFKAANFCISLNIHENTVTLVTI